MLILQCSWNGCPVTRGSDFSLHNIITATHPQHQHNHNIHNTTTNMAQSTPNIAGSDAISYIASSIFTYAPSQTVWETLIDTSTWPSWNTFCPRVTIRDQPPTTAPRPGSDQTAPTLSSVLQQGTRMTFHVHMDPASQEEQDVHLVVTEFQPPNATMRKPGRISWGVDPTASGTLPQFLLRAERVHEVAEVEREEADGTRTAGTEVRNWEVEAGWVAYAVRWKYGELLQGVFETWVHDLKGYVEGAGSGS